MAWTDEISFEHGGDLAFQLIFLGVGVSVGTHVHWARIGKEMDAVGDVAGRGKLVGFVK